MNNNKHTSEPWICNGGTEIGTHPLMLIKIAKVTGDSYEEATANAKRIVDCVNAFVGIDDPIAFREKYDKMELALISISEYCNRDRNYGAIHDACAHNIET